jgi:hypothetical protein
MQRLRNQLDDAAAKLLLKLSKKGKGTLDPQLAIRVLGPMGWKFEKQPVPIYMTEQGVDWGIRQKLKSCGDEYSFDVSDGVISSWKADVIECAARMLPSIMHVVAAQPARPELMAYYTTAPVAAPDRHGRHAVRVQIWRGGTRWTVTAPNGSSKHFDVSNNQPTLDLAPLWTFFYKNGLDKQAAAKLAESPDALADAKRTKAERERVEMQRSALPEIAALFRKITDAQYKETIKFIEGMIHSGVKKVLAIGADHRVPWHQIAWGGAVQHVMQSVRLPSGHYGWQPKPDLDKHVHAEAMRIADETREAFVLKNTARISEIAKRKGSTPSAKLLHIGEGLGGYGGEILFTFPDGSHFTLRNKTIWKQSSGGLVFAQFPTTFHNVVLPGNKKMASPSEARMLDVFAGGKVSNQVRRLMR